MVHVAPCGSIHPARGCSRTLSLTGVGMPHCSCTALQRHRTLCAGQYSRTAAHRAGWFIVLCGARLHVSLVVCWQGFGGVLYITCAGLLRQLYWLFDCQHFWWCHKVGVSISYKRGCSCLCLRCAVVERGLIGCTASDQAHSPPGCSSILCCGLVLPVKTAQADVLQQCMLAPVHAPQLTWCSCSQPLHAHAGISRCADDLCVVSVTCAGPGRPLMQLFQAAALCTLP